MPQILKKYTSMNPRQLIGLVAAIVLTVGAGYAAVKTFAASNTVAGLSATYYDNIDFTGKSVSRTDPNIAFDWSANSGASPATGIATTTWSARWTGTLTAPATGTYQFSTLSDDGVRAWIGSQEVVNSWTDHHGFTDAGTVRLIKGTKYPIKVEYYQNGGSDQLTLYWKIPGVAKVAIPSSALSTSVASSTPTPSAMPTPSPTPSTTPTPKPTPTPTPVASGACGVSTANVPDGPDGRGGCFPGPSNTGPSWAEPAATIKDSNGNTVTNPAYTAALYTGSCTISAANVTIDSKIIKCSPLNVGPSASGLLIKNAYVLGGVIQNSGSASFTIQDSIIDNAVSRPACSDMNGDGKPDCPAGQYACGDLNNGTTECGIGYQNFTVLRSEVMHTNRGAYCESKCTIQDSYFHGTNLWPDKSNNVHASGVRNEQYLTLKHNSLGCDYPGPFVNGDIGCSADVSGYPDFAPIMHDTIDSNLFLSNNTGTGFCVYGGGTAGKPSSSDPTNATYIVFTNNVFQRGANGKCGTYGPVTDFITGRTGNVWSGNKYDNGTTVPAN